MKNNKGISMITLVVTIVCMIIFLGIALRIGTRYISKSMEEEKNALITIMSDAATRRQNDKYVGLGDSEIYYAGYHIEKDDFGTIATNFESSDYIYEPGLWHLIDAQNAKELGITNPEQYLVENLQDDEQGKGKYVAVVDYYTGKVFLVPYADTKINVDKVVDGNDHTHVFNYVTCTENGVCAVCGKIIEAFGHNYSPENATCTEDAKCTRCGHVKEYALGHEYDVTVLKYNNEGHYNECIRCQSFGNFEYHTKKYAQNASSEWKHTVRCEDENGNTCGFIITEDCTKAIKPKDVNNHRVYCTLCLKEEIVSHDDEKIFKYINEDDHMVCCKTCNSDLYEEEHVDVNEPYGTCDKCNGLVDIDKVPEISELTMKNITDGITDIYWVKKNETILVTIRLNCILSIPPTVKIQGQTINAEDISNPSQLVWQATINTSDYNFTDGKLDVEVSNLRSMWGVEGESVSGTTDNNYIQFDKKIPEYIFIPS